MTDTVRIRQRRWLLALVLIAAPVLLVVSLTAKRQSGTGGLVLSFVGYTNLPNNATRFALFSMRNQAPLPIRWRGNWVELEGSQYNNAPVINPSLPFFSNPMMKRGGELTVAIGEPLEEGRWRFAVLWSPYGLKERALDFAMKHRLPTRIGRWSVIDAQQILNPTNFVTNSSTWLAK